MVGFKQYLTITQPNNNIPWPANGRLIIWSEARLLSSFFPPSATENTYESKKVCKCLLHSAQSMPLILAISQIAQPVGNFYTINCNSELASLQAFFPFYHLAIYPFLLMELRIRETWCRFLKVYWDLCRLFKARPTLPRNLCFTTLEAASGKTAILKGSDTK